MAIETIPFREIEKQTKDIYEATVVASKRARQIIAERAAENELEVTDEEPGLMDIADEVEDYVEEEKPTTIALREFLKGDIKWRYDEEEEKGELEEE